MSDEIKVSDLRYLTNAQVDSHMRGILQYNRFRIPFANDFIVGRFSFVFITRPRLHFFTSDGTLAPTISNRPEFYDLLVSHPYLFKLLQDGIDIPGVKGLIPPLFNYNIDIGAEDRVIKTREVIETSSDWKMVYGHRMNDSVTANNIDLKFRDDRQLSVYNLFNIWVTYIHLLSIGEVSPRDEDIINKELIYASSIYHFVTKEDGRSIIYATKYTGAYPLNIPDSTVAEFDAAEKILDDYTIQFQYMHKGVGPLVIEDFKKITDGYGGKRAPDEYGLMTAPTWTPGPFISGSRGNYKLDWRE